MSAPVRLRRLARTLGKGDLKLMHKAQMIYQTSEVLVFQREFVTILMGKLFAMVRDKIIEMSDVDQLLFQGLISYFHRKHKESYK